MAKRKAKSKSCDKGYPCGRSCISRRFGCKKKLMGQASTYAGWLKKQGENLSESFNKEAGIRIGKELGKLRRERSRGAIDQVAQEMLGLLDSASASLLRSDKDIKNTIKRFSLLSDVEKLLLDSPTPDSTRHEFFEVIRKDKRTLKDINKYIKNNILLEQEGGTLYKGDKAEQYQQLIDQGKKKKYSDEQILFNIKAKDILQADNEKTFQRFYDPVTGKPLIDLSQENSRLFGKNAVKPFMREDEIDKAIRNLRSKNIPLEIRDDLKKLNDLRGNLKNLKAKYIEEKNNIIRFKRFQDFAENADVLLQYLTTRNKILSLLKQLRRRLS